jgi:phosphoribosylformimino-5-aminoimidazole carboxamide ribotide isomerase
MDIIPAIDIRGGRCVQLVQGDYGRETVFGDDPVAMAAHWVALGARRLHIVDLDGAREGRPVNDALVARIIQTAGVPVQVAGGVRDAAAIDRWAAAGARRIVAGTLAIDEPHVVEASARRHAGAIAIAVDARDGMVAVRGWLETSAMSAGSFIRDMMRRGIEHFVYTDISRDGMLEHPGFDGFGALLRETGIGRDDAAASVIYSGGITSVEDVERLATEYEIEGVIIGSALYTGRIDLHAAQRALSVGDDW